MLHETPKTGRLAKICDGGDPGEADDGSICPNFRGNARHASREGAPNDPIELRSCPYVAQMPSKQMSRSCGRRWSHVGRDLANKDARYATSCLIWAEPRLQEQPFVCCCDDVRATLGQHRGSLGSQGVTLRDASQATARILQGIVIICAIHAKMEPRAWTHQNPARRCPSQALR